MIVSDKHKYVFVEIPLTASWAIRHELCTYYDGVPVLHKHATYRELCRDPTFHSNGYFVFGTVRNPLDVLVSRYCKYKSDHRGTFSNPTSADKLLTDYADSRKYEFVSRSDVSFEDFVKKYCRLQYSGLVDVASDRFDFVIRYETIQQGFAEVLGRIGLEQVRPVPVVNKTVGKQDDWASYYTPWARERAKRFCGPFMLKWGYKFPDNWGDASVSPIDRWSFRFLGRLRETYFTRIRYNPSGAARIVRQWRARLTG